MICMSHTELRNKGILMKKYFLTAIALCAIESIAAEWAPVEFLDNLPFSGSNCVVFLGSNSSAYLTTPSYMTEMSCDGKVIVPFQYVENKNESGFTLAISKVMRSATNKGFKLVESKKGQTFFIFQKQ